MGPGNALAVPIYLIQEEATQVNGLMLQISPTVFLPFKKGLEVDRFRDFHFNSIRSVEQDNQTPDSPRL